MKSLFFLSFFCLWVAAQTAAEQPCPNEPSRGLTLTLQTSQREVIPFEPLYLTAIIRNETGSTVNVPGRWDEMIRLQIWDERTGRWVDFGRWWIPATMQPPLPSIRLKPGDSLSLKQPHYTFDPYLKILFPTGKTHCLRAILTEEGDLSMNLISNRVLLRGVSLPKVHSESYETLRKDRDLILLLLPTKLSLEKNPDAADRIQQYVRKYPDSPYALYMRGTFLRFQKSQPTKFNKELSESYRKYLKKEKPLLLKETESRYDLSKE